MQKFTTLTGVAAPLPMINVDTDKIIPKQHLKTIARTGLGKALFDEMKAESEFDLLGLFQGVGLPFRSNDDVARLPNMVWLYRRPILDYWAEHEETLGHVVRHVLIHEIGHHFGLSDDDMEAIEAMVGD